MISRTLVPVDVRPPSADQLKKPPRRTTTYMDERTVVPPELSDAPPLDGKSSIPDHLPLGVLVDRTLVPRGLPAKPIERSAEADDYVSVAVLDSRVVVPAYVEPVAEEELKEFERPPEMTPELREVVEPDIFITGDPNLLVAGEAKRNPKNDAMVRAMSVVLHIALIVFLVFSPKIFPTHPPSDAELANIKRQMTWISPSLIPEVSRPSPPPGPRIRISPKVLNKVAPPAEKPAIVAPPTPSPEQPARELPSAPVPRVSVNPTPAPTQTAPPPQPSEVEPIRPQPASPGHYNFNLPSQSPSRELQDQLQAAIKNQGRGQVYTAPGDGGLGRAGGGGGGRGPGMQGGVSILSPTDGVDFNGYLTRLVATVRRNWYAVMPESAYMGEKGIVSITFCINPDGSVPTPDPILERTSGREPLDNAAMSSIRMSNPFEPLPREYKEPCLRLRFIYFYNILPAGYAQ
ncbi:MAG TPA: TonB C-terminal domain-containing protein [Candidatus Cybelea sp.]|nr:TonB C-terminal domain-containing protein [Candidatus Cybelea sp.]